jgi:hypothetical protein
MSNLIDLIGQKFGRLTVVKRGPSTERGEATWLCKCECGTEKHVRGHCLRRGDTKSCGCLAKAKRHHRTCQKCKRWSEVSEFETPRARICKACRGLGGRNRTRKDKVSKPKPQEDDLALKMARMKW